MVAATWHGLRKVSVLAAVVASVLLPTLHCASEDYDARARELASPDPGVRFNALGVLIQARNSAAFDGSPFDLSGKYELFQEALRIGGLGHIHGVAYLLSGLPEDTRLVEYTLNVVKTDGSKPDTGEVNPLVLVGALTYLEKQRPDVFEGYFTGRKYEDLDENLKRAFAASLVVAKLRDQYYRELIVAFVQWKPPQRGPLDQDNPFRPKLLELGAKLTPVIAGMYPSADAVLPLAIICLLGEIGDLDAFDLLLREYLARPSIRTAVSLGSCLGSLSMNKLFEAPFTPETTRELLQHVYGDKWESVKDLSVDELRRNLSENREAIRANCKLRSMPQLG